MANIGLYTCRRETDGVSAVPVVGRWNRVEERWVGQNKAGWFMPEIGWGCDRSFCHTPIPHSRPENPTWGYSVVHQRLSWCKSKGLLRLNIRKLMFFYLRIISSCKIQQQPFQCNRFVAQAVPLGLDHKILALIDLSPAIQKILKQGGAGGKI